jgi:hypothetical protein
MASHRQRPTNEDLDGGLKNYPFVRFAKSRKIQKGEDFESATVDARWVSKSILNRRRRRRRHRKSEEEEEEETEEETAALERACSVEFVFLSLFDGHGGKDCADFCAKETLPCLLKALNSLEAELKKEEKLKVVETNEVRLSLSLFFFSSSSFLFARANVLSLSRASFSRFAPPALCASSFSSLSGRFARAFLLTFFYFFHRRATESGGRVRVPSSAGVEVGV